MNRARTFVLSPPPPPGLRRPAQRRRRVDSSRPRSRTPLVRPVRLRGRSVTPRQRFLSGWTGRLPDILLTLLFVAISFAVNIQHVTITEFHPDESRWMNRGYYVRELQDPFGPTWQEYVTTVGQPPLGSFVMGIGLWAQGRDLDATGVWDFAYDEEWNSRTGAMPTDEDLIAGRRTNAVVGALATGAVYVLGRLLTNRFGGIMAALFVAWHPLHITLSSQALSDETLALLLALIFIAGWYFAKKPTWSRAIVLGVLLGLGGSVKLTPLLLAFPLMAFGIIRWTVHRDSASRRYALMLLVQPAIALATFVLTYPYLWPSPIRRTWELYMFRKREMDAQNLGWPESTVNGPLEALARFGDRLTHVDSTSKAALMRFHEALGIERVAVGLDFIPAAAGVVLLLWWCARMGIWTPAAMVALLMAAEAGILVVGLRADFYRYHLPIVVIMAGCIGISTGTLWSAVARLLKARSRSTARQVPIPSTRQPVRKPPDAVADAPQRRRRDPATNFGNSTRQSPHTWLTL
jgi:4-amino-4-deoxy-L-arabinose transferase-like glycosyltransferase